MFGGRTVVPPAARRPGGRRSRNIRKIRNIRISGGRGTPAFARLTDAEVGLGAFSAFAAFRALAPAFTRVCGPGIGITGYRAGGCTTGRETFATATAATTTATTTRTASSALGAIALGTLLLAFTHECRGFEHGITRCFRSCDYGDGCGCKCGCGKRLTRLLRFTWGTLLTRFALFTRLTLFTWLTSLTRFARRTRLALLLLPRFPWLTWFASFAVPVAFTRLARFTR